MEFFEKCIAMVNEERSAKKKFKIDILNEFHSDKDIILNLHVLDNYKKYFEIEREL